MNKNDFLTLPLDAALQNVASSFDCGAPVYNSFLRSPKAIDPSYGKTYVLTTMDRSEIVGYYNIGTSCVEFFDGYQSLKQGGSIHINYLALDQEFRGVIAIDTPEGKVYWSDMLLNDCLQRIKTIREEWVGFLFVTLTASTAGIPLYRRFGFSELDEGLSMSLSADEKSGKGVQMYLPLEEY